MEGSVFPSVDVKADLTNHILKMYVLIRTAKLIWIKVSSEHLRRQIVRHVDLSGDTVMKKFGPIEVWQLHSQHRPRRSHGADVV
jgi:hypothetical protein